MPRKVLHLCRGQLACIGRFNEAGAVMPRKGPWRRAAYIASLGFNEAGAVMPRKGSLPPTCPQRRQVLQ